MAMEGTRKSIPSKDFCKTVRIMKRKKGDYNILRRIAIASVRLSIVYRRRILTKFLNSNLLLLFAIAIELAFIALLRLLHAILPLAGKR